MALVLVSGCINQAPTQKKECTGEYRIIDGICCVDLDVNNVCDEAEALKKAREIERDFMEGCVKPMVQDSRHPTVCCLDADADGACDYFKDL